MTAIIEEINGAASTLSKKNVVKTNEKKCDSLIDSIEERNRSHPMKINFLRHQRPQQSMGLYKARAPQGV